MPWIRLDDQWMEHPKVIAAGRDARDVWLASITWCAKYMTDGFFHSNLLPSLAVMAGIDVANCQQIASTLLAVGLWDATENNYKIHDYLDYNPSKEEVKATKEARKEAGRAGGLAKAAKSKQNSSKTLAKEQQNSAPSPSPNPLKGGGGEISEFAKIYEGEIGGITAMISDELQLLSQEFTTEWFSEAVKVAVENNARKLGYVKTILERWKKEGFKAPMIITKKSAMKQPVPEPAWSEVHK